MPQDVPTDRPARGGGEPTVTLAVAIGAHGINGQVRLKVFAEDFGSYKSFNGGTLTLKSAQAGNNGLIARFAEIADRNAAEALRGTELTVPRSLLPPLAEGEYYHADLMGLPAVSTDGDAVGTVVLIENFGAGDVLEIERADGKRFMIPMNADAVPEWNRERLVVNADFVE
jgi:16S rRNA processing protein RimM